MGTFMGLAVPLYSDSGAAIMTVASDGSVSFLTTVTLGLNLASTLSEAGVEVSVTSTGALTDATVTTLNGFTVSASSKSVLNSVVMYDSVHGGSAGVSTAVSYLAVNGSKAPSYFLKLSGSAYGLGAAETNGFFGINKGMSTSVVFSSTVASFATLAVLAGTYVFYIPCYPNTLVA
jgi:hypothetical protein